MNFVLILECKMVSIQQNQDGTKHSREVKALGNQRVDQTVHDWHQNQDQDRIDSLVGRE